MIGASLDGPVGPYLAIAGMTVATYLCRIAGVVAMRYLRVTPRFERGLRALPGSIVVATVLPTAIEAGLPAALGLAAGVAAMILTRDELAGRLAGLGAGAGARALGR